MADRAREVREIWFGREPLGPAELGKRMTFWFGGEQTRAVRRARDAALAERLEPLVVEAAEGKLAAWASSPRRCLSLILLLDQLPRNLYRGTARAFATDRQALALTLSGIQSGADGTLAVPERIFFYMPLQHAESLEAQDESVTAYRRLLEETPEPLRPTVQQVLGYAQAHREVIRRFGRFPHRNTLLGRATTREERAYLAGELAPFERT